MAPTKPTYLLKTGRKVVLGDRVYEVKGTLGDGGSGEVYHAQDGDRPVALKVFFPFYQLKLFGSSSQVADSIKEAVDFQRREYDFLSKLSHPNIVKVFDAGEIKLNATEKKAIPVKSIDTLPVLVTEFIDGVPLGRAITELALSPEQLAYLLLRFARALEYLHGERHYLHVDIKQANILVRKSDREPVLIDFALCKNLNFAEVARNDRTRLLGDWDLFPKDLPTDHRLKAIKETDGSRDELERLAFPWLDLYQVGKLLHSLIPQVRELLSARELSYLTLIAEQLTDWTRVTIWGPRELVARFARLGPEHFAAFGVPELAAPSSTERTLMIPPGIGVPITTAMERIIDNRSFRRLATINQLCLLGFVYPGADYKRSVHVLYAYELARQFVTHLYGSPMFRAQFDARRARQLLATVLLHDINHFLESTGFSATRRVRAVPVPGAAVRG